MKQVLEAGRATILSLKSTKIDDLDPAATIILSSQNQNPQSEATMKRWVKKGGTVLCSTLVLDIISSEHSPQAADYVLGGPSSGGIVEVIQRGLDGLWGDASGGGNKKRRR